MIRHVLLMVLSTSSLGWCGSEIFRETFQRPSTGGNWPVSRLEWKAYVGESGVDVSDSSGNVAQADFVAITNAPGNPSDETGALFARNDLTKSQTFAVVKVFGESVLVPKGSVFHWAMGNETAEATVYVLIQTDGDGSPGSGKWFVSTTPFRSEETSIYPSFQDFSAASLDKIMMEFQWPETPTAWEEFELQPDTVMRKTGSSPMQIPSQSITGIGFFIESGPWLGKPVRIDTATLK